MNGDLIWVGVDFDNTLAHSLWTEDNPTTEIGPPIEANLPKARALVAAGFKVIIHTARPSEHFSMVEAWLLAHDVPFKMIVTGKILTASYVDDKSVHDSTPSWIPGSGHCATCTCHVQYDDYNPVMEEGE